MITGAPPIRSGDKLYIYYRALANRHTPYEGKDTDLEGGGICLVTMRVDGFASVAAGYDGGRITTKPFLFNGSSARINATANFGQIAVEVLDERRNAIPGFSQSECAPLRKDSLDQTVYWKGFAAEPSGQASAAAVSYLKRPALLVLDHRLSAAM
jgi:hypothetical protein